MERVIFKNQPDALLVRQTVLDEGEIEILVPAVKFVADDGMAEVREVDADLMLAAGAGQDAEQGERDGDEDGGEAPPSPLPKDG